MKRLWPFLESSPKTQVALALAFLVPAVILIVGDYATRTLTFAEPLTPLADPVREAILHHYLEAAVASFLAFLTLAVKTYAWARKRLLHGD
jgi:hypothetical protein